MTIMSDAQIIELVPENLVSSRKRLALILAAVEDWDGYGGVPANRRSAELCAKALATFHTHGIRIPSLSLIGGTGHVELEWNTEDRYAVLEFGAAPPAVFALKRKDNCNFGFEWAQDLSIPNILIMRLMMELPAKEAVQS